MGIDLGEVQNIVITNSMVEQYTCYNLPLIYPEYLTQLQTRSLQEFEKLYDTYQSSPNKQDILIKKIYPLHSYALYSLEKDYVIMATISHNRTEQETKEILNGILQDAKSDENSCFILKWY